MRGRQDVSTSRKYFSTLVHKALTPGSGAAFGRHACSEQASQAAMRVNTAQLARPNAAQEHLRKLHLRLCDRNTNRLRSVLCSEYAVEGTRKPAS